MSKKSNAVRIGYVTDIEGILNYWERFVQISSVLYRDEHKVLQLRENCELVFGGDVCDRGSGDIRIVTELLGLKERFPDKVHFILGNRDGNKLRLAVELLQTFTQREGRVYWNDEGSGGPQSAADRLRWVRK